MKLTGRRFVSFVLTVAMVCSALSTMVMAEDILLIAPAPTAPIAPAPIAPAPTSNAPTDKPYTKLTAHEDLLLAVYKGFGDTEKNALECAYEETIGTSITYYYDLPAGNYNFIVKCKGYYTWHKNFIITEEDLAAGGKNIDANSGEIAESGKYDADQMLYSFTDELLESDLMSIDALLEKYPNLLDTPAFNEGKANGEHTSQEEMEAFITGLDTDDDDMYVYKPGKTQMGKDIYLTVHTTTDLKGKTMEEAAQIIRQNGKPTVCMYGLIHGLEPSGGEGPLATILMLDGAYGETVLDKVNVMVLPWINGDGAERYLYGTPGGCANLNRYNLTVDYPELEATHLVYNLFMPEVVTHCHEKGMKSNGGIYETGRLMDVGLDISVNQNSSDAICELSKEMMMSIITTSAEEGFRMDRHEQTDVSGQYPIVDINYYGLRGSISLLIEVPGIRVPKDNYARRTASHFVVMKNLISYVIENSEEIMKVVAADRKETIAKGRVYNEDDKLTLRHGKNATVDYTLDTPTYNLTDGTLLDANTKTTVSFWETSLTQRTRPTAYVISADWDEECLAAILKAADYNNIKYFKVDAGTALKLRGYSGNETSAVLNDAEIMSFANGAYVFPMAQDSGNALAMLMEPDVHRTDSYGISLVQSRLLIISEIYRSEQNLIGGIIPASAQTVDTIDCAMGVAVKFAAGVASSLVLSGVSDMLNK